MKVFKKMLSVFLTATIFFTSAVCMTITSSAADSNKKTPDFFIFAAPAGAEVRLSSSNDDVEKWSVMYSKNKNSGFKGYKNISGKKKSYTINNLEYGTTYYFYIKTVVDGKSYKSTIQVYTTPDFENVPISVYNNKVNGSVNITWSKGLAPDSVSVYYSETKDGQYVGFKNAKITSIGNYTLKNLDFDKKYYIKVVFEYNGKKYTSQIDSITTIDKPDLTVNKSGVTDIVQKSVQEKNNTFSIYYKSKSAVMSTDDMYEEYKCFADVDALTMKKSDGTVYITYTVKYKNYPNILFAYATGKTSHLSTEAKKNYEELKKIIASETSDKNSDKENVLAIHDYLVNNTDYDIMNYNNGTIPERSYRITGLLQYGKSVCNGYTETFQLLMDMLGINCVSISGTAKNSVSTSYAPHAWNIVEIDDKWYQIDVTWDDPSNVRMLRHNYYLITDKQMNKNHKWESEGLPVCDGKTTYTDKQSRAFVKKLTDDFVYYETNDYLYQGSYK